MLFRQLYEPESSTYTYLIGCPDTRRAVLIDPVMETVDRDLAAIQEFGLELAYSLDTHIHADHVTSACRLRSLTGCKIAYPAADALACADVGVSEDQPLTFGSIKLEALFTPGHTDGHNSYVFEAPGALRVFTGDALLIDGCGRTDFQNGDSATLYRSVTEKIFALPDDCIVCPAHDYHNRRVSTVAQERARNPRLAGKTLEEFVAIMGGLNLPYPKKIDIAVPANRLCGACPTDLPENAELVEDKSRQG